MKDSKSCLTFTKRYDDGASLATEETQSHLSHEWDSHIDEVCCCCLDTINEGVQVGRYPLHDTRIIRRALPHVAVFLQSSLQPPFKEKL
jgi:hypothetical protein